MPTLLTPDGTPFTTGTAFYYDVVPTSSFISVDARIYIGLRLGESDIEFFALVDSAAPWCIVQPTFADMIRSESEEIDEQVVLSTRLGRFQGSLHRGIVRVVADEGETLAVDTTFFLSPDWPGGNFVGYQGFLERLKFAVDPTNNLFYFGHA